MLNSSKRQAPTPVDQRQIKRVSVAGIVAVAFLTMTSPGHAQSFRIPDSCNDLATGSEDDLDPVAIISYDAGRKVIQGVSPTETIMGDGWFVVLDKPVPDTYSYITTYTPFLTTVKTEYVEGLFKTIQLPAPGFSTVGTKWHIFPALELTVSIDGRDGGPNAYGFVDFIPYFPGSSPFTLELDKDGEVKLHCVQAVNPYYEITVYASDGNYLYDGYFKTTAATAKAEAYGAIELATVDPDDIHPNSRPVAEQRSSLSELPEKVYMEDIGGVIRDVLLGDREALEAAVGTANVTGEGAPGDVASEADEAYSSDPSDNNQSEGGQ